MRLILALLGLMLCWEAGAATWYVRSSTECPTNGDGTAYACATTNGGVGAWRQTSGSATIGATWASVAAGDTLKFCGTLSAGSNGSRWATMQLIGTSGSHITVTGDCSAEGGSARAVLDGGHVRAVGIDTSTSRYVDFQDFDIQRFAIRPLFIGDDVTTATPNGDQTLSLNITLNRIRSYDSYTTTGSAPTNITTVGQDITVQNSTFSGCYDNCATLKGKRQSYLNNTFSGCGANGSTVCDFIQMSGESDDLLVSGNWGDKTTDDHKQCFAVASVTDGGEGTRFVGNTCIMSMNATNTAGIFLDASGTVERNFFYGGLYGVHLGGTTGYTQVVRSNIVIGMGDEGQDTGCYIMGFSGGSSVTATFYNNTGSNCGRYGLRLNNPSTNISAYNNTVYAETECIWDYSGASPNTNNNLLGCAEDYTSGAGHTAGSPGANSLAVNPLFVGGSFPSTVAGFRLTNASPLRRVGKNLGLGNIQDYGNRAFNASPSIGAWEATSGDDATTRTAATRTVATRSAATTRTAR